MVAFLTRSCNFYTLILKIIGFRSEAFEYLVKYLIISAIDVNFETQYGISRFISQYSIGTFDSFSGIQFNVLNRDVELLNLQEPVNILTAHV